MVDIWFLRIQERTEGRNLDYTVEALDCEHALGFAQATRLALQGGVITFILGVPGTPEQPGDGAGRHVVARLSQAEAEELRERAGVNATAGFYTWTGLGVEEAQERLAQAGSARRTDR